MQVEAEDQLDRLLFDAVDDKLLLNARAALLDFLGLVAQRDDAAVVEALDGVLPHGPEDVLAVLTRLVFVKERDHLNGVALDPVSSNQVVAQAQDEVHKLEAAVESANAASDHAAAVANDERGGKASPQTSGRPGAGPKTAADEANAQIAANRATELTAELDTYRQRLDAARAQVAGDAPAAQQLAQGQVEAVSKELAAERQALSDATGRYDSLAAGRDKAIEAGLTASPSFRSDSDGLLTQMTSLWTLLHRPEAAVLISLVLVAGTSLELSFFLTALFGAEAVVYCVLLFKTEFLEVEKIADALERELGSSRREDGDELGSYNTASTDAESDDQAGAAENAAEDPFAPPPKRPRGRPRKEPPAE
ncbi:MAG: DUF4407 domain-containing protein [Alphaproteobacteria bacterium]|nr:DUF4407 domain-containing protein [Alphaproteobacteria bacterium]